MHTGGTDDGYLARRLADLHVVLFPQETVDAECMKLGALGPALIRVPCVAGPWDGQRVLGRQGMFIFLFGDTELLREALRRGRKDDHFGFRLRVITAQAKPDDPAPEISFPRAWAADYWGCYSFETTDSGQRYRFDSGENWPGRNALS